MKILLYGDFIIKSASIISEKLNIPHELLIPSSHSDSADLFSALEVADVLVSFIYKSGWPYPSSLKLLQVPGAGTEDIDFRALPDSVRVCLSFGHEHVVSEYIIMGLLVFFHNLKTIEQNFRKEGWAYSTSVSGPFHDQLLGKNIGIVGYGAIGKAASQRLHAMGCNVYVCSRTPPVSNKRIIKKYFLLRDLEDMVGSVDALIISIALTPETDKIINDNILRKMKSTSFIINVARGGCIDEESLYSVLVKKQISGAMIDTWWNYPDNTEPQPCPGNFNWASLPNVIMTPHISALSFQMLENRIHEIIYNIKAISDGSPLKHLYR